MRIITPLLFIAILAVNGSAVYGASTADLQTQITALLQQVQVLQSQLQTTQGSTVSVQGELNLTFNLRLGSSDVATNGEVSKLQQFLAKDKTIYPEGLVTGYFGSLTEAAVKRWQMKNGIQSVGAAGPVTRDAIKKATAVITPSITATVTVAPALASTSTAATSTVATSTVATSTPPASTLGSIILSPFSGQVGDTLTITGSGFTATGNDINFGAGVIKNLNSFNGGSMITFQIPSEAGTTKIFPGTYDIYVSNSNGRSSSSTFVVGSGVSYPSITSISSSVAKVGETITLYGSGFTVPSNQVHFGVGGRDITTLAKHKGTLLTFQVPASINNCDFPTGFPPCTNKSYSVVSGSYAVYIVNQNGKTNSVTFTVTQY